MRVQNFSTYTKIYEAKLAECEFLTEQNITADDIINPLEGLITEEIWDRLVAGAKSAASAVGSAVKGAYTSVKDAIGKIFSGIVNFFKNFSIKKLLGSIWNKIKEIGTKAWNKIKDALSGFKEFIVSNGLCNENNKPEFKRIWEVMCTKAKGLLDWNKEGVSPDKLKSVGAQVKINEAGDSKSIGDDEVKYYGFFEKVAHAMGIRNARFNGVVSQILQKGTIGLAIMGMLKLAGFSLAGLSLGLSPVAMAAIGGMLLMAGLIILAIWVCKPYPTVDDCLAYLHTAFGGNLAQTGMTNIFIQDIDIVYVQNTTIVDYTKIDVDSQTNVQSGGSIQISDSEVKEAKPLKSMYPTMIKNLQALQSMIISFEGVSIQGKGGSSGQSVKQNGIEYAVGKEYIFTNKEGVKRKVLLKSITHDTQIGPDNVWATSDDVNRDTLKKGYGSVVWKDKDGKYSKSSREMAVLLNQLNPVRESISSFRIFEKEFSKEFSKQPRNVEVTEAETHVVQAVENMTKSMKSLKDEKDKGIGLTEEFIKDILDKKMDVDAKKAIKELYQEIYEHLYGKYSKTLPDFGPLYKESVQIISDKNKRKIVAEKMARLAKRTLQFEGENMYASLGEFGADMRDYNTTLKEIMASFKSEAQSAKESYNHVFSFENYTNK